jgi:hypothetical protein
VDFGEWNDKMIKGLMNLFKIVSRFCLYIHEQPLRYLFVDEYYMAYLDKDKILRTMCGSRTGGWLLPCVMSD